jgi:hypothetical protein
MRAQMDESLASREPRPTRRRTVRGRHVVIILGIVAFATAVAVTLVWAPWSTGKSADEYAMQACAEFPFAEPGNTSGTRNPFDATALDETVHSAQLAANTAASAAKRDNQWEQLAQAYSALLTDLANYRTVLGDSSATTSPSDMSPEWHESYNGAVASILVECRKARAD